MSRSISLGNALIYSGEAVPKRMPAEWEPHAATWLAWPHYHGDWPGKFEPIPWVYTEIVRNLSRHERVELIVNDAAAERRVRKLLTRADVALGNVRFHRWPTNRVWLRDSGCIFVVGQTPGSAWPHSREPALSLPKGRLSPQEDREGHDFSRADQDAKKIRALAPAGSLLANKFRFNAWAKYSNWRQDDKIGSLMASLAGVPEVRPLAHNIRVVLEGGSIDVNGRGTLLTTEECLLSKTQERNPGFTRQDYEEMFHNYLGITKVLWLGNGIAGDDTHGHVDDLTRFVDPTTVVTIVEENPNDANYAPLQDNLQRLQFMTDQDGKPLRVETLPMPAPVYFDGQRLPASYANFYIANKLVIVPTFNDPNDRVALHTLAKLFPDRQMVGIHCRDLVLGLGTLHCMTQQQPAAR